MRFSSGGCEKQGVQSRKVLCRILTGRALEVVSGRLEPRHERPRGRLAQERREVRRHAGQESHL